MADIELKPCPFCGFEGVEIISGAFGSSVAVARCTCGWDRLRAELEVERE